MLENQPLIAEAARAASPLLDPPTRAVLLMALLAFIILGMGLMFGVMLGGRWVRRLGSKDLRKPLPLRRGEPDAQAEREPAMLRHTHWGAGGVFEDTVRADGRSPETKSG